MSRKQGAERARSASPACPIDPEGDIAIPLQDALTFAKLMDGWFSDIAKVRYPAGHPYLALDDPERDMIEFGFRDLVNRLYELDQRVSGPNGISPR